MLTTLAKGEVNLGEVQTRRAEYGGGVSRVPRADRNGPHL